MTSLLTEVRRAMDSGDARDALRLIRDHGAAIEARIVALEVLLSHYDKEGNRIPTEEFMREVVKEARAARAK